MRLRLLGVTQARAACRGPPGPQPRQVVCENGWCCVMVPRRESEELESSEPPAAAPASASPPQPMGRRLAGPRRICLFGDLFNGGGLRTKAKPLPLKKKKKNPSCLCPPSSSSGFDILDPCMGLTHTPPPPINFVQSQRLGRPSLSSSRSGSRWRYF